MIMLALCALSVSAGSMRGLNNHALDEHNEAARQAVTDARCGTLLTNVTGIPIYRTDNGTDYTVGLNGTTPFPICAPTTSLTGGCWNTPSGKICDVALHVVIIVGPFVVLSIIYCCIRCYFRKK